MLWELRFERRIRRNAENPANQIGSIIAVIPSEEISPKAG